MKAIITIDDTEKGVVIDARLFDSGVTDGREVSLAAGLMVSFAITCKRLHDSHALNWINEKEVFT